AQREFSHEWWSLLIGGSLYVAMALAAVASIVRRYVRTANILVLGIFLIALVTWPVGLATVPWPDDHKPWLWFLISVATAYAAVALPFWMATLYLFVAPVLYGIIRASPYGGSV